MSVVAAVLGHSLVEAALWVAGLALLAGVTTALAAFVYRARARTKLPEGAILILGLGVVAISLNTRLVFIQFLRGGDPLTVGEAMVNVSVFAVAGVASYAGGSAGDRLGVSNRISWGWLQPDFSPIVRAAGRFITVSLPETVDDIEGYDAVDDEVKASIAGRELDFPRGLTLDELHSQVVARLKEKYDVGYVDVEISADGSVDYLGVGQRAAGLGPTLPPKSAAVALRADPPFSATAGDTVQLWRPGEDGETRVGTAELRASVDEVVTVATDEAVAEAVDPGVDYRLMTLSADSRPDREFAAMLRRGDETMSTFEIGAESPLVGSSVGALDVTVIAVRAPGGEVETIPSRDRLIGEGDSLFAIGRPDTLRKLESAEGVRLTGDADDRLATAADVLDGG